MLNNIIITMNITLKNFSFNIIISLVIAITAIILLLNNAFFNVSEIFFFEGTTMFSSETASNAINTEIVARRVGSGLATSGLGGVGAGIGLVFSGLIKGFSRNPSLKDELFSYAIFGFALTEAIGLFALMMAFMLLYA